jgi:hypothetical protein
MCKTVHRMQSENKTDTKVVSPRPETEGFSLGTCVIILSPNFFDYSLFSVIYKMNRLFKYELINFRDMK